MITLKNILREVERCHIVTDCYRRASLALPTLSTPSARIAALEICSCRPE